MGYTFADNGNLTERRTFSNSAKNNPLESIAYAYPNAGALQAHGVTERLWQQGNGQAAAFAYDEAGRQWQRPGQVVAYNSDDLPEKIVAGSMTTTYAYDADGTRYQKKSVIAPNLTRTTTYAGGLYELREEFGTAATQPRTHVYYISAGNTVLAQLTRKEPDLSDLTPEYMHNDHLGTVSFTTSSDGVASNKVRTDPYGNRFDPAQAPRLDTPPPAAIVGVTRGYTGQEMEVDDLGVINMKGRIFDPVNGRFNSPDPIVQAPQFSQSYNRYMYVMGNPLAGTDPTGYKAITLQQQEAQNAWSQAETRREEDYANWVSSQRAGDAQASYNQGFQMLDDTSGGDRGKMSVMFEQAKLYTQSGGEYGMSLSGKTGRAESEPDTIGAAVGQTNSTAGASVSRDQNQTSPGSSGPTGTGAESPGNAPTRVFEGMEYDPKTGEWTNLDHPSAAAPIKGGRPSAPAGSALRDTADNALNAFGFLADQVSGSLAGAKIGGLFEGASEALQLAGRIGAWAARVGVFADALSVFSSLEQGRIPISGLVGLASFGIGFAVAPEIALFIGFLGAVGSVVIPDPPMRPERPALFPAF